MTKREEKQLNRTLRRRTLRSINFVLWGVICLFSVAIVLTLAAVYNVLVSKQLWDHACSSLKEAGEAILADLPSEGEEVILSVAYDYGIGGAYLCYEEGGDVTAYAGEERPEQVFGQYAEALSGKDGPVCTSDGSELVYGVPLTLDGRAARLYLTLSLSPVGSYRESFFVLSIVASMTVIVLSFAIGTLIAMLVSRPVTEVLEQAKELSRGSYEEHERRKYFFSEIEDLSEALSEAGREISRADRTQRELIANVSHDFKTPLTMIKAYASMILEISGDNKEKRDAHAQIIIDETDRLSALVSDVLDLSRLEAGEQEERTDFDLSEEVHVIAARFGYLKTQGYRFEICVEDGLWIEAERGRIGQVIYNLIGNAVNYTGEDKRVRVKLGRHEEFARLEIIDSGKGIPPEEVNTIWDRYYRSKETHKRPVQGTGLGLSIVKNILLRHDSPFGVISEVGKGSCFWAEFRLVSSEKGEEER